MAGKTVQAKLRRHKTVVLQGTSEEAQALRPKQGGVSNATQARSCRLGVAGKSFSAQQCRRGVIGRKSQANVLRYCRWQILTACAGKVADQVVPCLHW